MELSKSLTFKIYLKIKLPTSIIIPAGCQKINIKIVKKVSMTDGFMCNNVQESRSICIFANIHGWVRLFLSIASKNMADSKRGRQDRGLKIWTKDQSCIKTVVKNILILFRCFGDGNFCRNGDAIRTKRKTRIIVCQDMKRSCAKRRF